jgi:toxin-antitoxin system PIN domain toxin
VSRAALLDVNVLVALFNPEHIHHELAHDWFADHHHDGWATCPLTENGFVRLLSTPNKEAPPLRAAELVDRLRTFCKSANHVFWSDTPSILDASLFNQAFIRGHRQLTDIYLLGLARKMNGTLATFDRTIPLASVVGATRNTLAVISAPEAD